MPDQKRENRLAAGQVFGAGLGMTAAGAGAEAALNQRLTNRGAQGLTWSLASNAVRAAREKAKGLPRGKRLPVSLATHGPHLAGLSGARALQMTGVPMAAWGGLNMARGRKQRQITMRDDVVKPIMRRAALVDAANKGGQRFAGVRPSSRDPWRQSQVAKGMSNLTPAQQRRLKAHRKAVVGLSTVGGTLGLAALATRAPQAAKVLASRGRGGRLVSRLAALEPAATRHSNTLGVTAIGTGSLGSFNWAAQQRLESKKDPITVKKGLPRYIHHAGRARRVLGYDPQRKMLRLENPSDPANPYLVPRGGRKIPEPLPDPVAEVRARQAQGVQLTLPFGKADRWLRDNRDRISPKAEEGYERVRQLRNEQRFQAGAGAVLAGLAGGLAAQEVKRVPRNKTAIAATLAGSVVSGHESVRSSRQARELEGRLVKIRSRGEARAAAGLYGRDRGKEPVDLSSRTRARNLAGGV